MYSIQELESLISITTALGCDEAGFIKCLIKNSVQYILSCNVIYKIQIFLFF